LSLGSSANYQDSRGLTPLYYCIANADNAQSTACMEVLLYDHAAVDAVDHKGCTPLHQVRRDLPPPPRLHFCPVLPLPVLIQVCLCGVLQVCTAKKVKVARIRLPSAGFRS